MAKLRARNTGFLGAVALLLGTCPAALGQAPPPGTPTTVQLPTFSFFTVQTTVSVPDSGGALLGGIGRGADHSAIRGLGPLANRGQGSSRGASSVSVSATIIDQREMDAAVLAQAATSGPAKEAVQAHALSQNIPQTSATSAAAGSLAEIRAHQAAAAQGQRSEAAGLVAKAQRAEAENKPGLAKIYYQMVLQRDAGALRGLAQSRLKLLSEGSAVAVR